MNNDEANKADGAETRCSNISPDARIVAKEVSIGEGVVIEAGVTIGGFNGEAAEKIVLGDFAYLGHDVNIACPSLILGDYVTIHRRTGVFGEGSCVIGHNCWIGQDCILNTHGRLWIGNNVGIGAANHIWTHTAYGELFEGCRLFHAKPVVIEDDVWICGGHSTINPGLKVSKKCILFPQSSLTRSTVSNACYAGNPARRMDKLKSPYKTLNLDEKRSLLVTFVGEFQHAHPGCVCKLDGNWLLVVDENSKENGKFNWGDRTYQKRGTAVETKFIRFMRGYRARFVPEDQPCVGSELLECLMREYPGVFAHNSPTESK